MSESLTLNRHWKVVPTRTSGLFMVRLNSMELFLDSCGHWNTRSLAKWFSSEAEAEAWAGKKLNKSRK